MTANKNHPKYFNWILGALLLIASLNVAAQFRVEVNGVGLSRLPIAFAKFRGEEASPQKISSIVRNDLNLSGQFDGVQYDRVIDESQRPDVNEIKQLGFDAALTGSISQLPDGRYEVRFRLWDIVANEDLGAKSYVVDSSELRLAAHKISDFVFENLTAEKGIFSTRLAFVTKQKSKYTLWVSDIDGENAQSALSSPEPIISPSWSPDGSKIAYVSFESRKPSVYIQSLTDGSRRLLANFKGSNSAPVWSKDGKTLLVALSKNGLHQIYSIDAKGGEPRQFTRSFSIDTEPVFNQDGLNVYFVSDRSGSPQIYKADINGSSVTRITFEGGYNTSPSVSPDGKLLAYISKIGKDFKLKLINMVTSDVIHLTNTVADERPSFSPNGKLIVYATEENGQECLMMTTLDGRVKTRLVVPLGDLREPNWGPYETHR